MGVTRVTRFKRPTTVARYRSPTPIRQSAVRDARNGPQPGVIYARWRSGLPVQLLKLLVRQKSIGGLCSARVDDDTIWIVLAAFCALFLFLCLCGAFGCDGGVDSCVDYPGCL